MILLTIPRALLLRNQLDRMHWRARAAEHTKLASELGAALNKVPFAGIHLPIARARVTVRRYSTAAPDTDNLYAGCKLAMDCLLTPGPLYRSQGKFMRRHHLGLSILVDDNPQAVELIAEHVKVAHHREQRTEIEVVPR